MTFRVRPKLLAVFGGLVYLAARSFEFLTQSGYPSGYWYDLGVHIVATSYQASTIHSLQDVVDSIGWSPWGDVPEFAFNPMVTSMVLVMVAKLGASSQQAVKLLIVAQFWIALISMTLLYLTKRRSWSWALLAGLLYALFPATALQISSNLDLGFSIAFAPLALAVSLRLIRRAGVAALPLAGAICGSSGEGFAVEYLLVVSIPLYAIVSLMAYDARHRASWLLNTAIGSITVVGVGLFCFIPTIVSSATVSSPASRISDVESGSGFALFGETIGALWHGVLTESTLSPWQEFNVSSILWSTSIALTLIWWSASHYGVRRVRRRCADRNLVFVTAVLLILSFGTSIPFAATFWLGIARIPLLQFLRTPDRLAVVPFVIVVWWSALSLQTLSRTRTGMLRRLVLPVVTLTFVSFSYFAFEAGALIVRPTLDFRLPSLDMINSRAQVEGPPVAAYTFVHDGSVLDTPLYGLGIRTRVIAQDLISRFSTGPAHAIGVLRKAGIRTVITTPTWTRDGGSWPDLAQALGQSELARKVVGSQNAPMVWSLVGATSDVSLTKLACFHGGPGLIDELATLPDAEEFALTRNSSECSSDVYADADPRDGRLWRTIAAWPAARERAATAVLDHDYSFVSTRVLLSRPWYRNSIDGDTPVFSSSAERLTAPWHNSIVVLIKEAANYDLEIRSAYDGTRCFLVAVDAHPASRRCEAGGYGLHWHDVPLRLGRGTHKISLSVPSTDSYSQGETILDGAELVARAPGTSTFDDAKPALYAFSSQWVTATNGPRPIWVATGNYRVRWYGSGRFRSSPIYVDGILVRSSMRIQRGYHRINRPPANADLLIFQDGRGFGAREPRSIAVKESATSWRVAVAAESAVRATVLNDGSWFLDGPSGRYAGFDCDLVDTCFGPAAPGTYVIHHEWPRAIVMGFSATLLTWLVAIGVFSVGTWRRRQSHKTRSLSTFRGRA